MKTIVSTLAIAAVIAAATGAQARDLAGEFRTGFNPSGMNTVTDSFRTGFNPDAHRTIQGDLDQKQRDGHAKPDSFGTGFDPQGK